jgi:hypothetical protein
MVSSLPFLAPIFLRKAKEYTSKYSGSGQQYGAASNGGARRFGKSGGEGYKLSSVSSPRKGTFATAHGQSSNSEENILKSSPDNSIVKSVSYSVQVD